MLRSSLPKLLITTLNNSSYITNRGTMSPGVFPDAYQVLNNAYTRALETLRQEDSDVVRYKLISSNIVDNLVPILESMEGDDVLRDWVDTCAHTLGPLVYELQVAALAAEGMSVSSSCLLYVPGLILYSKESGMRLNFYSPLLRERQESEVDQRSMLTPRISKRPHRTIAISSWLPLRMPLEFITTPFGNECESLDSRRPSMIYPTMSSTN
ncbi:hypothetical protein DFH07DRAFT_50882 [Mycena maculata]|uniref:Uncharacterized protein n=1 Tax=Mycena maculata TaxID=230809 RepID=A0AAD7N193_9AGAR|nr:hypothetical protein DFH07DRAFT_50882 [Mycena maculata]